MVPAIVSASLRVGMTAATRVNEKARANCHCEERSDEAISSQFPTGISATRLGIASSLCSSQ
jgi:hypothetical protein